jgi:3-deoxy-D-manno-octulosonate 8-phosphate phosphatase (KDO 8-P phosphatase)
MMSSVSIKKLHEFKGLILDVDGVLFSGQESRATLSDGAVGVLKTRSLIDGQGISFLRALGIKVLFASGEDEPLKSIVEKINQLPSVLSGDWEPVECFTNQKKKEGKVPVITSWLEKHNLTWSECVYIGDDRTDWEAMSLAGLKVAPANATRMIKKIADIVLEKEGGNGAIREFAELVLDSRNIDESTLPSA